MSNGPTVAYKGTRQQILALLYEYSWGYDSNDMPLMGGTFKEGGRTGGVVANSTIGWGPWQGRDEIVSQLSAIRCSQPDRRRHVLTSPIFEELSESHAVVRVYLSLFSYGNGAAPHLVTTGEYVMKASKQDGVWLMDLLEEVLESAF
ncbi:nuclear transport factor 2 family protein [Variovorax sp. J31P207]|uniref:nuclear transport factor 2 family protein n=1 Tax=Variovorax sp. J31P207 TaxID=3053510 RepID=UPI002576AE68|nr:nuclear transport factor 2 family protein [Variovorax sp. J31P207]MDM0071533.1 nuclear transport factor 2 family protein [Variovorax sp. J31P207]